MARRLEKATAGAYDATTATLASAHYNAFVTLALQGALVPPPDPPPPDPPAFVNTPNHQVAASTAAAGYYF